MAQLPPILVINLARAEARRAKVRERLEAQGLDFEFVEAVDGRGIEPAAHPLYDAARRRRVFGRDLTGGEIGCFLSHRSILERMVAEEIEEVLVLEDDAILGPDFLTVLAAIRACPVPYDMVRFFGDPRTARRRQRRLFPLGERHWLTRLATASSGAQVYLIRLSGARCLLPHMQRIWIPVDALMGRSWTHGLRWFTVSPPVADYDRAMGSDIGDDRFFVTLDSGPAQRALHLLSRFAFKFSTAVGKRWIYWSAWPGDRRYRQRAPDSAAAGDSRQPVKQSDRAAG